MPIARYKDEVYNMPFNMNTFNKLWGVATPKEAQAIIEKQKKESGIEGPCNLEEQAISLVGKDIYEKLIKVIPKNNGERTARNCLLLLLNACHLDLPMIIIISMIAIKGMQ